MQDLKLLLNRGSLVAALPDLNSRIFSGTLCNHVTSQLPAGIRSALRCTENIYANYLVIYGAVEVTPTILTLCEVEVLYEPGMYPALVTENPHVPGVYLNWNKTEYSCWFVPCVLLLNFSFKVCGGVSRHAP